MSNKVKARQVRYIKLGEGGSWAEDCIRNNTIRIGFWTDEYHALCSRGQWDELATAYRNEKGRSKGTATRFSGEVRVFYEDDGSTLWITFHDRKMYWTFIDPKSEPYLADGEGMVREAQPWRYQSVGGTTLWMVELAGGLTKTAAYRGTSCEVDDPDYVIRRVNDEKRPENAEAEQIIAQLEGVIVRLMRLLTPPDFELMVDLIFSASGWRRRGLVGGPQDTVDIELELPSTGDRAFIQVKSATSQAELSAYQLSMERMGVERMFFAYHTGSVDSPASKVTLLGPQRLSRMVIEAGLVTWLMKKVG